MIENTIIQAVYAGQHEDKTHAFYIVKIEGESNHVEDKFLYFGKKFVRSAKIGNVIEFEQKSEKTFRCNGLSSRESEILHNTKDIYILIGEWSAAQRARLDAKRAASTYLDASFDVQLKNLADKARRLSRDQRQTLLIRIARELYLS